MTDHRTYPCQLCGDQYLSAYLFHLKDDPELPGGAKVTCLKCWGRLEERKACAKICDNCYWADEAAAAIRARGN